MSLYNMVFGNSAQAPLVLALLDKPGGYFGRFRDAWIEQCEDGSLRLAVYTRNGGGNREHYDDDRKAGPDCDCTGCIATFQLPRDPLYITDRDDDFDATYATFYFRVPDGAEDKLRALAKEQGIELPEDWTLVSIAQVPPDMRERWEAAIEAIKSARTTETT